MNSKINKGRKGEELALRYLEDRGYKLLEKNWRSSRSEIDLIMMQDDVLVFVEVKYRTTRAYGHPEESVSTHKIQKLQEGIQAYQEEYPQHQNIRLDVLSIFVDKKNNDIEYFHIEDVYF